MKRLFVLICVAAVIAVPSFASANLVENGNFSSGFEYWNISSKSSWQIEYRGKGNEYANLPKVNSYESLYQYISPHAFPAGTFTLSFSTDYSFSGNQPVKVFLYGWQTQPADGKYGQLISTFSITTPASTDGWTKLQDITLSGKDITFTTDKRYKGVTLRFDVDPKGKGSFFSLDNVVLTFAATDPKPTPLPASVILLGCGLLGLVGIRRRRKE